MTLLSTTSIVGGGTTTISSINQGYNHLYVVIEGAEGGGDGAGFKINSSVSCNTLMTNQATSSSRSSSYGSGLSMVFYNYPSYDSASTELKNFGYQAQNTNVFHRQANLQARGPAQQAQAQGQQVQGAEGH